MNGQQLLFASFVLNQATVLFVLGCHTLAARATWLAIGPWGRALTLASAALWITMLMRLLSQLRLFRAIQAFPLAAPPPVTALFFWSVAGFLCALAVGYILRQTMLALVGPAYSTPWGRRAKP